MEKSLKKVAPKKYMISINQGSVCLRINFIGNGEWGPGSRDQGMGTRGPGTREPGTGNQGAGTREWGPGNP